MCGIAGIFNFDGRPDIPQDDLRRAVSRMERRGPDDRGFWAAPGMALGHRRLAVIDLATGQQPLVDAATGAAIAFNGEIFNYRELRPELEACGRAFATHSDTEVLLQAWLEWGPAALPRLSGMFAFAVCDPRRGALFLARDRVGVKPLFWAQRGGRLLFASSMGAMLCLLDETPALDAVAVSHYLTTIRTTLGPRTLVRGVQALQPGEYLQVARGASAPEVHRYWEFPALPPAAKPRPEPAAAAAQVRDLMTRAVQEQLISDVPLGGFLSGGLDSSVLAGLAAELTRGRYNAYSVGYDLDGYNEWPFVREAAEHYRMQCREIHLAMDAYATDWQFLVREKGLPLSTPNEVAIYRLAHALKQDFTVALSGEGADEVFGGYVQPYFSAFDFQRAAHAPPGPDPLGPADRAIRRLYKRPFITDAVDHHFLLNSWMPAARKTALFATDWQAALGADEEMRAWYADLYRRVAPCSVFDQYMQVHARVNLEGLLFRVDSSTMAAAVEARVPFTDHRVIEYLFQLPDDYKMRWRSPDAAEQGAALNVAEIDRRGLVETKVLLRQAFAARVPADILARRKMSFPAPVPEWLASTQKSWAADILRASPLVGSVFDRAQVDAVIESPDAAACGMVLWPLVNLCLWAREFRIGA